MTERREERTKSHHGCSQCKTRRVKCDETKPRCRRCVQRDEQCSLSKNGTALIFVKGADSRAVLRRRPDLQLQRGHDRVESEMVVPTSSTGPGVSHMVDSNFPAYLKTPSSPNLASFWSNTTRETISTNLLRSTPARLNCNDACLRWYFTNHAWRSLAMKPHGENNMDTERTWRIVAPSLALDHPVLHHAMLAISALHWILASESSIDTTVGLDNATPPLPFCRQRMLNLSLRHQSLTLAPFRDLLQRPLSAGTQVPSFLTALLVALYAFSSPILDRSNLVRTLPPAQDPFLGLLKFFTLLRGSSPIVQLNSDSSSLRTFRLSMTNKARISLVPEVEEVLLGLDKLCAKTFASGSVDHNATEDEYVQALDLLRQTYALQHEEPHQQAIIVGFALYAPRGVLTDIAFEASLALCVAAAFAVILHSLRASIWIQDQGRYILQAIVHRVTEQNASEIVNKCIALVNEAERCYRAER